MAIVTVSGTGSPPNARITLHGDLDGDQVAETLLGVAAVDGIGDWEITPDYSFKLKGRFVLRPCR